MREKLLVALTVLEAVASVILIGAPVVKQAVSIMDICKADIARIGYDIE